MMRQKPANDKNLTKIEVVQNEFVTHKEELQKNVVELKNDTEEDRHPNGKAQQSHSSSPNYLSQTNQVISMNTPRIMASA